MKARQALSEDRLGEALQFYRGITPQDPLWPEKLEDLIRYHLRKKEAEEAWRIVQIARRTQGENSEINDYERISVMLAGGCPFSLPPGTLKRDLLLEAATYRLNSSIFESKNSKAKSPDDFSLAPGITPYLEQIPKAQILKGQGCRLAKILQDKTELKSSNPLASLELKALLRYLQNEDSKTSERTLVLIRALELADFLQLGMEKQKLQQELLNQRDFHWEDFPDPERQWIFSQIYGANALSDLQAEKKAEAQNLALRILDAKNSSARWLALVDLETLNSKRRQQVLARADELGDAPDPGWILYQRARLFRDQGEPLGALQTLRRLLVQEEVPLDAALSEASLDLASEILSEHRLDQRLHGALEAAIPGRLWASFLQKSFLNAALSGSSRDFREIQKWLKSSTRQNFGWTAERLSLLEDLAERNLSSFKRHLDSGNLGQESLFQFSQSLAAQLAGQTQTPKGLQAFLDVLSERLLQKFPTGSPRADQIAGLTQIFNSLKLERVQGQRSVRQGTLRLGSVRWKEDPLKKPNWSLSPPQHLPRRELFYLPDPEKDRGWIFSSALR